MNKRVGSLIVLVALLCLFAVVNINQIQYKLYIDIILMLLLFVDMVIIILDADKRRIGTDKREMDHLKMITDLKAELCNYKDTVSEHIKSVDASIINSRNDGVRILERVEDVLITNCIKYENEAENICNEIKNVGNEIKNISNELINNSNEIKNISNELINNNNEAKNISNEIKNNNNEIKNISNELKNNSNEIRNVNKNIDNIHKQNNDKTEQYMETIISSNRESTKITRNCLEDIKSCINNGLNVMENNLNSFISDLSSNIKSDLDLHTNKVAELTINIEKSINKFIDISIKNEEHIVNSIDDMLNQYSDFYNKKMDEYIQQNIKNNKDMQELIYIQGQKGISLIEDIGKNTDDTIEDLCEQLNTDIKKITKDIGNKFLDHESKITELYQNMSNDISKLKDEYITFMNTYNQIHKKYETSIESLRKMNSNDISLLERMLNER